MKTINKILAALVLLAACLPAPARNVRPLWVRQGEEQLNARRKSGSYEFKIFRSFDADLTRLRAERFSDLLDYAAAASGADAGSLQLDTLSADRALYLVSGGGAPLYARLVDEYTSFEDYVDNEYGFERWQLFAVSALPDFDDFQVMEPDNALAAALSIVPGAGQFYKGATGKACAIIGTELSFGAGAFVFQKRMEYAWKQYSDGVPSVDSWESKKDGYKLMRNVCFGAMAGCWLYGLIDAAVTDGAARVKINAPKGAELTLGPATYGVGLSYKF